MTNYIQEWDMDVPKYACDKCCRKCAVLHHWKKQDGTFRISSFFKIMFGQKFEDVLIVPPKFARTLEPLVGEKFYFEDSSGLKWDAILSDLGNSLGFQKGWQKFSGDHGIELGDLVVFHYIEESYFQVEIYGRTGCQKFFSAERTKQDKGCKFNRSSSLRKSPHISIHGQSMPKRSLNTSAASDSDVEIIARPKILKKVNESLVPVRNLASKVSISEKRKGDEVVKPAKVDAVVKPIEVDAVVKPAKVDSVVKPARADAVVKPTNADPVMKPAKAEPVVEPCFITNRDTNFFVEDDSDRLFDLSTLEMPSNKPTSDREDDRHFSLDVPFLEIPENKQDANISGKSQGNTSSQVSDTLQDAQTEVASANIDQCQISEENTEAQSKFTATPDDFELTLPEFIATPDKFDFTLPQFTATPDYFEFRAPSGGTLKLIKQEAINFKQDFCDHSVAENSHDVKFSFSKQTNIANRGLGEALSPMVKGKPNVHVLMRPEPDAYRDSADPIKVTCIVPKNNIDFLELPEDLPLKTNGTSRLNVKLKEDLVFLRDPAERLWPVIYHHRNGFKVLTSGWTAFKKVNNIQPGDECTFTLESMEEGTFSTQIAHNN